MNVAHCVEGEELDIQNAVSRRERREMYFNLKFYYNLTQIL